MAKRQFKTESRRILDLMINSIYTHKEIFLRELISNASDAIDKLCYRSLTDESVGMNRDDFKITVQTDEEKRLITISDNGIGMTAEEMNDNLGVIARSGSLQFKQEMEKDQESAQDIDIIGQFGVGFYSAFMVADQVTVISRSFGTQEASKWVSDGADGYTITPCEKDAAGTDIILHVRPDGEDENYSDYLKPDTLKRIIKKYSDYVRWPIVMDGETVNSRIPIWQRAKSEVSDEDCKKFYRSHFMDYSDPAAVIRVSAEGAVSYKAMLFIPTEAPFDFYTANFQPGMELYSNGVMIMDKCAQLVPEYFRFVRGVVDSPDLSLNISRELLQHDRQLKIIETNLEKKIKAELKKLMENDPEKYQSFWKSFGLQIKYGVVAQYGAKKDFLADIIEFYSAREKKFISLDAYVAAMPEGQKHIYYACGENVQLADGLPQTEPVKDKGYDILYLTENVDEFAVQVLASYKDKTFKSVNDDDLDLGDDQAEKKEADAAQTENSGLMEFIKESLDGRIAAAKISSKLKSHPVCLTTQGPISLDMERYFQSLPAGAGGDVKAERVLELNAAHPVFEALRKAYESDRPKAEKYAKLLYNQALLIAGLPVEDATAFSDLVCSLMD